MINKMLPVAPDLGFENYSFDNLTTRDYIAVQAMNELITQLPSYNEEYAKLVARRSYAMADAMLKIRTEK